MFPNDRKSEIRTDNWLVSGSVANPDGSSSQISIHRNASQGSTSRLVTSIERALAGTRSPDLRTKLDNPHMMNSDVRLHPTALMYPAELDDGTQGVHWQSDRHLIDSNHQAYEELGKPGPTLRWLPIRADQADVIMPDVPSQSIDQGRSSDIFGPSTYSSRSNDGMGVVI